MVEGSYKQTVFRYAVCFPKLLSHSPINRSSTMTGKEDELKGRVKEAAGAITDNDDLRREGKIDQAAGKIKQAAEKVVEKVQEVAKDANKG